MLGLRTSAPTLGVAEAEQLVREAYGLGVQAEVLDGERDRNFRVRVAGGDLYLLKIMAAELDSAAACLEAVLAHLSRAAESLPVPRLLADLHGRTVSRVEVGGQIYLACLMQFMAGASLGAVRPSGALLREFGTTLARLDHGLRGFFHPHLAQRIAWDVRNLPALLELCDALPSMATRGMVMRAALDLRVRGPHLATLRSQAVHGDCHGGNVLVDGSESAITGIVDFGDMVHAPVIFEPAVAMSDLLTHGLADVAGTGALLAAYTARQPLEETDLAAVFDVVRARHATYLLVHAWRLQHDPAGALILRESAARAADSLADLERAGREALEAEWRAAIPKTSSRRPEQARRARLLGSGAELFYERPLHLVRGSGVWLFDAAERAYLDVYNNVPHVGHAHPHVVEAIARQTATLATNTRYLHSGILDYAERLTARLPSHLDTCIFVNSGSEANDVAWRIAKMVTGHTGALVLRHAYHGITDAVGAMTPGAGEPQDAWVATVELPQSVWDVDDVLSAEALTQAARAVDVGIATLRSRGFELAALFMDSAMTSSGILDPPAAWAERVAARVKAAGGLVIADEVQYGLGRSGSHFWGFERRGLSRAGTLPDMVTLGKPIGNGFPMGVVIAPRETIEAFQARYGFFSTFGGSPVAAAAGAAVLDVLEREQLMQNAAATGAYLRARLEALTLEHPETYASVRGAGLLLGLVVTDAAAATPKTRTRRIVNSLAADHRILVGSEGPGSDVIKLRPPMPFQRTHADQLIEALAAAAAL